MLTEERLKWTADRKKCEVEAAKKKLPLEELRARCENASPTRDFVAALRECTDGGKTAVIAEMKRCSPSRPQLREDYDPEALARGYEANGAACLSVLTDAEFAAAPDCADLVRARAACGLPVLRKDFIVDEYQIYESRAIGADCVLLIAEMYKDDPERLRAHAELAVELGMAVLPEAHDSAQLKTTLPLELPMQGINNRNLRTLFVSLDVTFEMVGEVPENRLLVSESGIQNAEDIRKLMAVGARAFLIGGMFMGAADPGAELARLLSDVAESAADGEGARATG